MINEIKIDEIIACEYHRNGVCGVGFNVVDFVWSDRDFTKIKARAIVFSNGDEYPTHYSVTTDDPLEKWRGDHFINLLWPIIEQKSEEKWQATLARIKSEKAA